MPLHSTPARHLLRQLLRAGLPTAADLGAFCADFFPDVSERFSIGMDRIAKVTLLLELFDEDAILAALQQHAPQRLADYESRSTGTAVSPSNPYRGLSAFQVDEARLFFGREALTSQLWQRFEAMHERPGATRLLAVVGPSGSGKSSVVRAGLLAALARTPLPGPQPMRLATFKPGERPMESLARALLPLLPPDFAVLPARRQLAIEELITDTKVAGQGLRRFAADLVDIARSPLVVFVDQFEELYTLCKDSAERDLTVSTLLHAASNVERYVSVVLTLRSDFLGETMHLHPDLNRLISEHCVVIGGMTNDELRRAIAEPARQAGHPLDSATIDLLLSEARGSDGALPLLEFALTQIWEHMQQGKDPAETLRLLGGVGGALAGRAQQIYDQLSGEEQSIARRAMVRLVKLGEGMRDTRRRAPIRDLCGRNQSEQDVLTVLRRFASEQARLVTLSSAGSDGIAEVTHEALFEHWGELRKWIEEGRAERRFHERLADASRLWHEAGRPAGRIWRSPDLDLLREFHHAKPEELSLVQSDFLTAAERQKRRDKASWVVLLALILGVPGIVWRQQRIQKDRQEAEVLMATQMAARAELLASWTGQGANALVLGIKAVALSLKRLGTIPPQAKGGLIAAYSLAKTSLPLQGHTDRVDVATFDPTGQFVLTGSTDRTARIWDARTGKLRVILSGHRGLITSVSFSADGERVLTTSVDRTARIWGARSGQLLYELGGHQETVEMGAFSPDGTRVLTGSHDHMARIWDTHSGRLMQTLAGHSDRVPVATFSRDGRYILTASWDKTGRLWATESGNLIRVLEGHSGRLNVAAFASNGDHVATGGWDNTVRLWDLRTFESVVLHQGTRLHALAFSPDSRWLASSGTDGVLMLWDGQNGTLKSRLLGHAGTIDAIDFSPDSIHIVTGGSDRMVRLWDVRVDHTVAALFGHTAHIYTAAFSPSGENVVTSSFDQTARVWAVRAGQPLEILKGHTGVVNSASFAPDGTRIITSSQDQTARLWRWPGGEQIAILGEHSHAVNQATFSHDGNLIATCSTDYAVRLWDGHDGHHIRLLQGHQGPVYRIAFSPDSTQLVTGGTDQSLRLWDPKTGQLRAEAPGHKGNIIWIAFSPDGRYMLTAGSEGEAWLRDGKSAAPLKQLRGHSRRVNSGEFFLQGNALRLVTSSSDRTVRIWDPVQGTVLTALPSFLDDVNSVSVSPDGRRLLIVSRDQGMRLWDIATESPLALLWDQFGEMVSARYSLPDGKFFLIATTNGTVRVYSDNYSSNLNEILSESCQLLKYQQEFQQVREDCPDGK